MCAAWRTFYNRLSTRNKRLATRDKFQNIEIAIPISDYVMCNLK